MNIETSNVTVSLELLDVSKMKVECRPPLARRRNSKTGSVIENAENAPYLPVSSSNDEDRSKPNDTLKALDSVQNIENNNMDKKSNTDEPKLSKEEAHEITKLRELLLLHLDLIQQQQDLMVMKDNQIVQYKEENANLKCRLERMERRMALLKGGNDSATKVGLGLARPQSASKAQTVNSTPREIHSHRGLKRKTSLEPQSLAKKFASIARKEYEKDKARGRIRGRHSDAGNYFMNKRRRKNALNRLSLQHRRKPIQIGRRSETITSDGCSSQGVDNNKSTSHSGYNKRQHDNESQITNSRSLRNRSLLSTSFTEGYNIRSFSNSSTPQRFQVDSDISFIKDTSASATPSKRTDSKNNKGKVTNNGHSSSSGKRTASSKKIKTLHAPKDSNIMKTDILYYCPVNYDPVDVISPKKEEKEDDVAVPSFRVKKFVPYYVIEGTENFDDEVYAKRHQKHESEEKKRKRWDLQRQRELEQVQKLQRSNRQNGNDKSGASDEEDDDTFVPDPDKVKYIEVCDEIPVSVFGAAIPRCDDDDFELPWFNMLSRERQEARKLKLRKK